MSHKEEYCECPDIEFRHKHTGKNYPFKEGIEPSTPGVEWEKEFEKDFCEYLPYRDTQLLCWKGVKAKNMNLIPTARNVKEWIAETISSTLERYKRETLERVKEGIDSINREGTFLIREEARNIILSLITEKK